MRILLIDPSHETSSRMAKQLAELGFVTLIAPSARHALDHGMVEGISAILADCGLDVAKAIATTTTLRSGGVHEPLFLMIARGDWRDKIACLDAGADDVLLQPVRTEEIVARLRAIIRRSAGTPSNQILIGGITLDLKARCAWLDGKCLELTRNEFRLLRLFMLDPDRPLSHNEIIERLNSDAKQTSQNALEVRIGRLRRKIGNERILTLRGVGYRFSSPVSGQNPGIVRAKLPTDGGAVNRVDEQICEPVSVL